jgi:hypothetical protein
MRHDVLRRSSVQVTIHPVVTGPTYVASLRLIRTPISGRVQFTKVYRVGILPTRRLFLSTVAHQSAQLGGNRRITDALTDAFLTHGIAVALQEGMLGR